VSVQACGRQKTRTDSACCIDGIVFGKSEILENERPPFDAFLSAILISAREYMNKQIHVMLHGIDSNRSHQAKAMGQCVSIKWLSTKFTVTQPSIDAPSDPSRDCTRDSTIERQENRES